MNRGLLILLLVIASSLYSLSQPFDNEYKEGFDLYNKGEKIKAAQVFENIYGKDSLEYDALLYLSQINAELHFTGKAARGFAKLSYAFPDSAVYASEACFLYTLINQPGVARKFGIKSVLRNPYSYNCHLNLAHTYLIENKVREAGYWYYRALQLVTKRNQFLEAFLPDIDTLENRGLISKGSGDTARHALQLMFEKFDMNSAATQVLDSIIVLKSTRTENDSVRLKILECKKRYIQLTNEELIKPGVRWNVCAQLFADLSFYEYVNNNNISGSIGFYIDNARYILNLIGDTLHKATLWMALTEELATYQKELNVSAGNQIVLLLAEEAFDLVSKNKFEEYRKAAFGQLITAYVLNRDFRNAVSLLHMELEWGKQKSETETEATFEAAYGLMSFHYNFGNLDSAAYFYKLSQEFFGRSDHELTLLKDYRIREVELHLALGKNQEALVKGKQYLPYFRRLSDPLASELMELMGNGFYNLGQADSARKYYSMSVWYYINLANQKKEIASTWVKAGFVRHKAFMKLAELAAKKNDYADLFQWIELSKENDLLAFVSQTYHPKPAYSFQKIASDLPDSVAALVYVGLEGVSAPVLSFSRTDRMIGWVNCSESLKKIRENNLNNAYSTLCRRTQSLPIVQKDSVEVMAVLPLLHHLYVGNSFPGQSRSVITKKTSIDSANKVNLANQQAIGRLMYDVYVAPFEAIIKGKKQLYVSADFALHFVPFESFVMPDGRYLGEAYDIVYVPGFTIESWIHRYRYRVGQKVIAFGNPDYKNYHPEKHWGSASYFSILGIGSWNDLPGSGNELLSLKQIVDTVKVCDGKNVSESIIKSMSSKAELKDASILHFALHGMAGSSSTSQLDNSLVVSEPDGGNEDGLLQYDEILGLGIRPSLVVLSACETSMGMYKNDGSLLSTATAFLGAGARSVLASIWSIDDEATATFMKEFYREAMQEHRTYIEAVANTKRKFIKGDFGEAYRDPYYWAPFKLIGN